MATSRLAGLASCTIDGTTYAVVGKPQWSPGSITRESLVGSDGVHGYKEKPRAPWMSVTLRDAAGMTVADFNAITDSTVVFQLASGKLVTGRDMWSVDAQEVDSEDGTFDVRFEGLQVSES